MYSAYPHENLFSINLKNIVTIVITLFIIARANNEQQPTGENVRDKKSQMANEFDVIEAAQCSAVDRFHLFDS